MRRPGPPASDATLPYGQLAISDPTPLLTQPPFLYVFPPKWMTVSEFPN
jgi:hypothetical protein